MKFSTVERDGLIIAIWCHTTVDPPQDEWDAALQTLTELKRRDPTTLDRLRMLVITDGGSPNLKQRAQLNVGVLENAGAKSVKTVCLSTALSNPLKRRIVQAVLWTNPNFKAYGPGQYKEALAQLGVSSTDVLEEVARMQSALSSPLDTLAAVRRAMAA